MELVYNTLFEEFSRDDITNQIILRNKLDHTMLQLSNPELDVVRQYCNKKSPEEIISEFFAKGIIIKSDDIIKVLSLAKKNRLAISDLELINDLELYNNKKSGFGPLILFMLWFQDTISRITGLNILIELQGSFKLFKIWSVGLEDTFIEKLTAIKAFSRLYIYGGSAVVLLSILSVIYTNPLSIELSRVFFETQINSLSLILYLLAGIAATYFIHEFSHYVVYRFIGGKSSRMGFALMYYIIPVFYTTVNSVYFWSSRNKKIVVSLAGIITDIGLLFFSVLAVVYLLSIQSAITAVAFLIALFLFARTLSNINPFMPGTDAYYIFIDMIGKELFFEKKWQNVKKTYGLLINGNASKAWLRLRLDPFGHLYYHVAFSFITLYWFMIFAVIYLPVLFFLNFI